jgi:tRNA threonylcarbamoyladenosine dehydratase
VVEEITFSPDYEQRFGGIARLYGRPALAKFQAAHVCIVGVGGVGSWLVEALARSGIGKLTLIDLDDVCITNVNRQLPALDGTIGRPKISVLAERVRAIHPSCEVTEVAEFLSAQNAEAMLDPTFSYVADCIDRASIKVLMIARCKALRVPVLTMGGAGGRRDALRIRCADLNRTAGDRLLRQVRKKLRTEHRFAGEGKKKHGVAAIFSDEPQVYPWADGTCRAHAEPGEPLKLDCASGYGAATHVTAAFALAAAGEILRHLADG